MDYMYHKQGLHTESFKPKNVHKLICKQDVGVRQLKRHNKMWNEGFDPVTPVISRQPPWQSNPSNERTCNPQPAE